MTLTDVISKRNVYGTNFYGKKVIVNDNSATETIVIEKSNDGEAVRITNTGNGKCVVIEDETRPDSTPVIIDEDGKVGIGRQNVSDFSAPLQVSAESQASNLNITRTLNNSTGVRIFTQKYRGSVGSEGIVQDNDELVELNFQGGTGSGNSLLTAAKIEAVVDGNTSTGSIPGELRLQTTSEGNSSPTSRVTIRSNGNVGIGTTSPTETLHVDGSSRVDGSFHVDGSFRLDVTTGTLVGPAGSASSIPGAPEGWMVININGTSRRIPYWAAP